jgi:hypothetical protein
MLLAGQGKADAAKQPMINCQFESATALGLKAYYPASGTGCLAATADIIPGGSNDKPK